jgi:DNA-binding MarR family transcriptional regulator
MQAHVKVGGAPAGRGVGGDALTDLELRAWRGMLRAHAGITRRLDADLHERHGMSLTSYEALMLLGAAPRGRMRVSELSGATLLSVSGMSRMIDRLGRDGLVMREACADDRRGAEVVLTAAGRERLRAARATHLAGVRAEFLSRFSDEELAILGGAWDRIAPPADGD